MDREELQRAIRQQKSEMSPEERMRDYLAGKRVDFIPYSLMSIESALAQAHGISKGQMHRSYEARCEAIRLKRDLLGITGVKVGMGIRGMGHALGSRLEYPENAFDYVSAYAGEDYHALKQQEPFDINSNAVVMGKIAEARRLMNDFPQMKISTDVAGPLTTAAAVRPVEMLMRDTVRNKDDLHWLLDYCVECSLQWVRRFCGETGSRSVSVSDPVTSTDVFSPRVFDTFSKPYLARLISGIRDITGKAPSIHICGHTSKLWQDLVDMGMVSFSLDDCESLASASQAIGDKVFLAGNVPPVHVLLGGTIDDVIHSVRKCIQDGAGNPAGFMLQTGCQVPLGTPMENIWAYIYAARKYGANAVLGQAPDAAFE